MSNVENKPAEQNRKPSGLSTLLLHLHPRMAPETALALDRTFGLGGITLLLFLVLIVSGALLLVLYEPSVDRAYASVVAISDAVPFGSFLRSIHHWAGNGLLIACVLHMLRVFYTGAFAAPRRFNWMLGLILLAVVMAANFTGYLLPWDQLSYWAVTIGTGMLAYVPVAGDVLLQLARGGGPDIGPKTLSLYFVLHIALLPIILLLLTSFHFWKVRKAGGVMIPRPDAESRPVMVPVQPNLTLREGTAALVLLAVLLLVSAVFPAPLQEQANPGMSPNPAKAAWYFLGFQELLIHLNPLFAALVVPLLAAAFLAGFPFLRYAPPHSGNWFHSPIGRRLSAISAIGAVVLVPLIIVLDDLVFKRAAAFQIAAAIFAIALLALLTRRSLLVEKIQAAFTFSATGFLVLTLIALFFRGESMRLKWPW